MGNPHLRPFSITPEGELSFETKKYVPKSRLKSEDYCKKNEVIFNNTNSPDLVGKTTVFDSDVLCAASNHMTRITVKEGVNPYYVAAFFNVLLSIGYWKLLCTNFKDRLLTWSEKYQITDAQIDTEQNAASNAECIEAIFNRYVRSTEQTIFMSRCFSAEYNETENAIRRAINEINNEKKTGIMLIRVDEHHEGTTGQISDRIFRDIESAGLVIADLSSGKLNVPHEIGYAMGLKKDLILVHNGTSEEAEKHIPSNIRMFEQIRFNGDYQTLQNEIKRRLIDYYSNQQKRFFTKEKFDEKFQKRIDYFSKVAMSFFANHGYDTEGFTINPYMVVNKVFSSYYKHVQFPIVTFDELKREIQL